MRRKPVLTLCMALLAVSFFCPGCSHYSRLLALENQLEHPEKYFSLSGKTQYTLAFNSPVLFQGDIYRLTGLQPVWKKDKENTSIWHYLFRKINRDGTQDLSENFLVKGKLHFTSGILDRILLPAQLAEAVDLDLLWKIICSVPRGRINLLRKTCTLDFPVHSIPPGSKLPSRKLILRLSGTPSDETGTGHILYRHTAVEADGKDSSRFTEIHYWFNRQEILEKASASMNGYCGIIRFTGSTVR